MKATNIFNEISMDKYAAAHKFRRGCHVVTRKGNGQIIDWGFEDDKAWVEVFIEDQTFILSTDDIKIIKSKR